MATRIRLNKQTKTIKVVNRKENVRLTHTKGENVRLQHTGKTGPASTVPGPQGIGTPTGGEEGQILQKESSADYDFTWMTPSFEDKTFTQDFTSQATITVTHNLGKFPSVTVIDTAEDEAQGSIYYASINEVIVSFSYPTSGTVTCN